MIPQFSWLFRFFHLQQKSHKWSFMFNFITSSRNSASLHLNCSSLTLLATSHGWVLQLFSSSCRVSHGPSFLLQEHGWLSIGLPLLAPHHPPSFNTGSGGWEGWHIFPGHFASSSTSVALHLTSPRVRCQILRASLSRVFACMPGSII